MGNSQSWKASGILHQTVSRLPVSNKVFLESWMVDIHQEGHSQRSAPQRRHTAHLRQRSCCHPGNRGTGTGEALRRTPTWRESTHQTPGHLSCSDLGRAQNAGPTESAPLWSIREPEPEQLRPGKCMQLRAHFRQLPCRATWSLSSVDRESTQANPVWPRHCEHSPQVWSVPPSPQHDSEPK